MFTIHVHGPENKMLFRVMLPVVPREGELVTHYTIMNLYRVVSVIYGCDQNTNIIVVRTEEI